MNHSTFNSNPTIKWIKTGFTLIELLVVISIIALLIGILLPALSQARETARAMRCLANQKQVALCIVMYANDEDGYYPRPNNVGGALISYDDMLAGYDGRPSLSLAVKNLDYATAARGEGGIYLCPSDNSEGPAWRTNQLIRTYFINKGWNPATANAFQSNNFVGLSGADSTGAGWSANETAVTQTSNTILLGEYQRFAGPQMLGNYSGSDDYARNGFDNPLWINHHAKPQFAFTDGHAESMSMLETLGNSTTATVGGPFTGTKWDYDK